MQRIKKNYFTNVKGNRGIINQVFWIANLSQKMQWGEHIHFKEGKEETLVALLM